MASVALGFNRILIAAARSLLQATLTLPGIAGIVLTIGMAVDANVLIFERIREELSNGRGPITAVDAGYRRAITPPLPPHLPTPLAPPPPFPFRPGPVHGFPVPLSTGLVTPLFSPTLLPPLRVPFFLPP